MGAPFSDGKMDGQTQRTEESLPRPLRQPQHSRTLPWVGLSLLTPAQISKEPVTESEPSSAVPECAVRPRPQCSLALGPT